MSWSETDHILRERIAAARADRDRARTYGRSAGQMMRAETRYDEAVAARAAHLETL